MIKDENELIIFLIAPYPPCVIHGYKFTNDYHNNDAFDFSHWDNNVWKKMVFDHESKYTYSLTNESLTQICGKNTNFYGISCGYGIWPPKTIKKMPQNAHIDDWGYTKWHTKNSRIRKYFI